MIRRNTNYIIAAFICDILSIVAALVLANWMRFNLPYGRFMRFEPGLKILFTEASLLYPLVFLVFSLYDPERIFRALDEYQILGGACMMGALALAGTIYFTARDISRLLLVYFFAAHFFFVFFWRIAAHWLVKSEFQHGHELRRVLLIGGGESAKQVLTRLHELSWAGVQMVGYLTDGDKIPSVNGEIPHLGTLNDAGKTIQQMNVDNVLIALPAESYVKLQQLIPRLIDQPCNIWVVPDYFSLLLYGARVQELGDIPMISLKVPTLTGYQRVAKRAFDLVVGGLSAIIALPIMGLIALGIKLDSPGPVLFRQHRVGENGRLFLIYKFRTMVEGAERQFSQVVVEDENGTLLHKRPNDPRLTRVGRILRRLSLDELPQLYNVMRGEMSLVGPRPELPYFVERYDSWQLKRLAVPQGITGWWQVHGRSDKPMHLHTEDDIFYVQHYSMGLDILILFKTLWAVLRRKGAF
jgi:exopolysaccharide biosynthesis polyprenyl glycosylphosphotransferase